jgi:hypothetical protein
MGALHKAVDFTVGGHKKPFKLNLFVLKIFLKIIKKILFFVLN